VIAGGDVMERPGHGGDGLVKGGIQVTHGSLQCGVKAGDQACPQWSDGAGSPHHDIAAVHIDLVAGVGISVAGHIRHPAAHEVPCVVRRGDVRVRLPGGAGKSCADSASCSAVIGKVVPDDLVGDGCAVAHQVRPAASKGVGTGGWEVDVVQAVADAVGGAVVAGRD